MMEWREFNINVAKAIHDGIIPGHIFFTSVGEKVPVKIIEWGSDIIGSFQGRNGEERSSCWNKNGVGERYMNLELELEFVNRMKGFSDGDLLYIEDFKEEIKLYIALENFTYSLDHEILSINTYSSLLKNNKKVVAGKVINFDPYITNIRSLTKEEKEEFLKQGSKIYYREGLDQPWLPDNRFIRVDEDGDYECESGIYPYCIPL